ncbi:MAG: DUF7681 family protein [Pseudomonadota bacterium]
MTKGEIRVGVTFNPSGDPLVAELKAAAAQLIDLIDRIVDETDAGMPMPERRRLKAIAQTATEEAAMWAVKAATKEC